MLVDRIERTSKGEAKLLTAQAVRAMFGDVSDMTLWRWCNEAKLGFPAAIYIGRRKFWRESDLLEFIQKQSGEWVKDIQQAD